MAKTARKTQQPKKTTTERQPRSVKIREDLILRGRHYALDHGMTWAQVLDDALEAYLKSKGA
jgi:hypothetical protein